MRITSLLPLGSTLFALAAASVVDFSVLHPGGQIQLSAAGSSCSPKKFKYECSGKVDAMSPRFLQGLASLVSLPPSRTRKHPGDPNPAGNYTHPYDCSYYISCIGQTNATETPCPSNNDGSLLYYVQESGPDPATSRCDYPEVERCECEREDETKCPCHEADKVRDE